MGLGILPPSPRAIMEDCTVYLNMPSHELAANESFQAFVFRKNVADILFWEKFVNVHPSKRKDVDQAVYILSLLSFKVQPTPGEYKELELNRLLYSISLSSIQQQTSWQRQVEKRPRHKTSFFAAVLQQYRYSVAASLALLICFPFFFTVFTDRLGEDLIVLRTTYGENATFFLPDSTLVILNGNTRLTHQADWGRNNAREVWLDGEAFFEVRHRGQTVDDRFIVHTPGMDVEVLGTKFNVFNRDHKTSVVLNSGKVKVNISADQDTSSVLMQPDEALEYSRKDHSVARKQVNAEALTSWRRKVLVFENTPLYKVGEMIEHAYGLRVIFSQDVDKNEKLAGTVPSESLDDLLSVLAKSSNLNIFKNRNEIWIERKIRAPEEP